MKLANWKTALALSLIATACTTSALADTWPSRPIRLLVPYVPGGATDQMARVLGKELGERLNQQVVIDNKPGASGAIAAEIVARAAPDGYTLLMGNSSPNAILPAIRKLNYEVRDFAPISLVAKVPLVWAVGKDVPARTMAEFIELAKRKPGTITFGSTGIGAGSHMEAERMAAKVGIKMIHVPFAGGAQIMLSMRQGDTHAIFTTGLDMAASVQAGTIRPLAIGTAKRTPMMPDLPTVSETIPGFTAEVWFGVLAPAGTPKDVRDKLQSEIGKVLAMASVQKAFRDKVTEPVSSTQAEFAKLIDAEIAEWKKLVRQQDLKIE